MTDRELSEIIASLVLLPVEEEEVEDNNDSTSAKTMNQFWKVLEYLTLRRIHQMSALELSKII